MAEAVAAYTGKKFPTKLERKLERRESKRLKKLALEQEKLAVANESDEGSEDESEKAVSPLSKDSPALSEEKSSNVESDMSSDDNDYQTADENEDNSESSSSDLEFSSSQQSEEEQSELGHQLIKDTEKEELEEEDITGKSLKEQSPLPSLGPDEKEEDEDDEEPLTNSTTPPTSPDDDSPESKLSPSSLSSYIPDSEFYQIDENYNDRGSNGSMRIYKNWRNLKQYRPPLGLVNQGVTCYMNAAIQALLHTPLVQHYLTDVHNSKYSSTISNHSVTKVFADTSAKIWQLDSDGQRKISMINPRKLIRRLADINCMMSEWQQEDSHEYFMSLMSRLQEDSTPKGHKLNESIIYDIFGGLLLQSVSCKNCGHVSNTEQEFYDLSLNLDHRRTSVDISTGANGPGANNETSNNTTNSGNNGAQDNNNSNNTASETLDSDLGSRRYSIKKSLHDFFSPELIKTDKRDKSGYVCEKCKQRTNLSKHNKIKRSPETLAVHLKRFRFNGTSSSKLKTGVSFPSTLDLTPFTVDQEPSRYRLISVVVHEGRSVSSGHYIAQCRQPDGSWSVYDDEYVNHTSEKEVLKNTSAYFLIYTRLTHKSMAPMDTNKRKLDQSVSPNKRSKK